MKRDVSAALIRHYILKNNLDTCFTQPYPAGLELHIYQKNEFLCRMGEPAEYISLIVDGRAQVTPFSADGRIVLLSHLKPLEMLGDIELLNNCPFLHDVYAETDLAVLAVSSKLFNQLMNDNIAFTQLICRLLAGKIYQSSMQHSTVMLYPLRSRLSRYLLEEIHASGSNTVPVRITALAQELGSSDRHLRRVINEFVALHIISKNNRSIIVKDIDYLTKIAHNVNI